MNRYTQSIALGAILALFGPSAQAKPTAIMVSVDGITHGQTIPEEQALCIPTADRKSTAEGKNTRPTIRWSGIPKGTESIAIFMMDPDVPADFSDAGKAGKIIAADAKRQDFFHYAVVNIPADATQWPLKATQQSPDDGTELVNDMGLNNFVATPTAYGGPCPPWNDARIHHYHYMVMALYNDAPIYIPTKRPHDISADDPYTAKNTFNRLMESQGVLAIGTLIGTYSLNPAAKKDL